MPYRGFNKAERAEWRARGRRADILAEPAQYNPDRLIPPTDLEPRTLPCMQCGAPIAPFVAEHRLNCPHCGSKQEALQTEGILGSMHMADASMPPAGPPMQPKETALPYNPTAYEGEVEGMHPAAQYTYQRAVAQGAAPQAAMAAAQEKQGEMMKRTQEGQNIEGVQIPVINSSSRLDRQGFVTAATIARITHLV